MHRSLLALIGTSVIFRLNAQVIFQNISQVVQVHLKFYFNWIREPSSIFTLFGTAARTQYL